MKSQKSKIFNKYLQVIILSLALYLFPVLLFGISQNSLETDQNLDSVSVLDKAELYNYDTYSLLKQGVDKMQTGKYHEAYSMFLVGLDKAEQNDSIELNVLFLNNLGNLFYYLNNSDSALSFYYQALDVAKQNNLYTLQNTLNNNIGIIYSRNGHLKEALNFINEALAVSMLQKDTAKIAINLSNLGGLNTKMGNFVEAHGNFSQAKTYFKPVRNTVGLYTLYNLIGELNYLESHFDSALSNYKLAISLLKSGDFTANKTTVYINIGKTLVALNKYEEAEIYLEQALGMSKNDHQMENTNMAISWLVKLNKKKGNIEKALVYSEQANLLKDSIILQERRDIIEESRIKYNFRVKEKEYVLQNRNTASKQFYWRILIVSLVIIILLLAIILRTRIKTAIARREKLTVENKKNLERLSVAKLKNKELKTEITHIEKESLKTKQELEVQLENINYELISKSLLIENKNQVLETINGLVKNAEEGLSDNSISNKHIRELKHHLVRDNMMDQNWEHFKLYFERIHTDFFKNVHARHVNLTASDLRLSAFLLLQFNSKEIAQVLNITPESVRKRKQRIKEKMGLDKSIDLLKHLYTFIK